jgi:hypothetical protein
MMQPMILQLNVHLVGSQPPIWRQLEIGEGATLTELHEAVQACMEWENAHMHQFRIGSRVFGPAYEPDVDDETEDEEGLSLTEAFSHKDTKVLYDYDFGDNWEHEIVLQGKVPANEELEYPRCTAGGRAAPPEDCGGIPGYETLLQTLKDPKHPDYEDAVDWLGDEDFDPEHFSITDINDRLAYGVEEDMDDDEEIDEDDIEDDDDESVGGIIIELVEAQVHHEDPPEARAALQRLATAGLGEDEAWDLLGAAYALEVFRSLAEHREFDATAYAGLLDGLPSLPLK